MFSIYNCFIIQIYINPGLDSLEFFLIDSNNIFVSHYKDVVERNMGWSRRLAQ
jgi:hypothetical protein